MTAVMASIGPFVALLLAVRAAISRDVTWKRLAGAVLAVAPFFIPVVVRLLPGDVRSGPAYYSLGNVFAPAAAGAYLFAWAFMSRDALWLRMASGLVGAVALAPVIFGIVLGTIVAAR